MLPEPDAAPYLSRKVISLASFVGLVDPDTEPLDDLDTFTAAVRRFHDLGVGRHVNGSVSGSTWDLAVRAGRMVDAIDGSPLPAQEWPVLLRTLGEELTADLAGVSVTSVRRYASGTRQTPDDVAERLHVVALIVASLFGSYNELGVRRWFHRSRTALNGKAPGDVLAGTWTPDDPDVLVVRRLADQLLGAAAG